MAGATDPHAVLGVRPGADQAEIHKAYRAAVRRTHPDAGGTAAAFEAVQDAYEALREIPGRRTDGSAGRARSRPRPRPDPQAGSSRQTESSRSTPGAGGPGGGPVGDEGSSTSRMEALLAESRRLEDEARRLAGLPPRQPAADAADGETADAADSVSAILRDATDQLREAAGPAARELRKRLRRLL